MKKKLIGGLLLVLIIGLTGCVESSGETDKSSEKITYNGIVYNKTYKQKSKKSTSYIAFNNENNKIVISIWHSVKNGQKCSVLEGTYIKDDNEEDNIEYRIIDNEEEEHLFTKHFKESEEFDSKEVLDMIDSCKKSEFYVGKTLP